MRPNIPPPTHHRVYNTQSLRTIPSPPRVYNTQFCVYNTQPCVYNTQSPLSLRRTRTTATLKVTPNNGEISRFPPFLLAGQEISERHQQNL